MSIIVFGLNHKSAPVSIREKLAHLNDFYLPGVNGVDLEAIPISTCNRVEIYYSGSITEAGKSFTELLTQKHLDYSTLKHNFYEMADEEAVRHLFNVAGGIDSMVLGENQILHQIKESYKSAIENGRVGRGLHNLFQKSLEVGKKVRSQTAISENRVSIASAAVDLAKSIFKDLSHLKALIIGAGEMANLVAVHMRENGVKEMNFINRTKCRALELSEKFSGNACAFEQLNELLSTCDIVISSTSAPHQIIKKSGIAEVMDTRNRKPLFMIDIAVPRDIEPACREISNVFLYDVDDLRNVINESLSQRKTEAIKAEKIIEEETMLYMDSLRVCKYAPRIKSLSEQANTTRKKELLKFFNEHPELTDDIKKLFEQYSYSLMAKWLHTQIESIKKQGFANERDLDCFTEIIGLSPRAIKAFKTRALRNAREERRIA
jgi:glutamyl-tRNA reductase